MPGSSLGVYVVACRFGFSEEAKEAAKVGTTGSIMYEGFDEEVRRISSADILRWVRFVQGRENSGRQRISGMLNWWNLDNCIGCNGKDGRGFYFRLEKAIADAFTLNPCIGRKELFEVLDAVPDPPPGCKRSPNSESAEFYRGGGAEDVFNCPLQPMSIRNNLLAIADDLDDLNRTMLEKAFGKRVGSG